MEKKRTSSSKISSSSDSAIEDYSWVTDKNFSLENKKKFLQYPLNSWREIVYEFDLKNAHIFSEGDFYENKVKKVLKNDVFDGFTYIGTKSGVIDFNLMEKYKVDPKELSKKTIIPDFFVHKIEIEAFNSLLENRNYMIKTFQKINANEKYVSIIGEIKISHSKVFKNNNQRLDYIKFIKKAISSEEKLVLMYVYDESYKLFMDDTPKETDDIFLILCYIPRLYLEDCYNAYNNIIKELKSDVKQIDLTIKPKKTPTKKELINELDKRKKVERIVIFIFILIIAFLLKK